MELPQLKTWVRLGDDKKEVQIYDVKFYPYSDPGEEPVFAAVAGKEVLICRPGTTRDKAVQILSVLQDPDEDSVLNSIVWTQDIDTGDPLLCVAGSGSRKIKILNALTGELVRTIRGHGGDINDLAISPISPQILASCSSDYSIRIWNLDPKYEKQPCAAILSGEGHRQAILSISFHSNGKWLVTGGQDTMICLWSIPEVPDKNAGTDQPTIVYYPHFASVQMHSDYIDCVKFWGDLILSRASAGHNTKVKDGGEIILWRIDGFSSANDHVPAAPMSTLESYTRSAFGGRFQRLLTFDMVNAEPFYMRFGLYDRPHHRPMLVMGNTKARFSFWDLQKLEEGYDAEELTAKGKKRKKGVLGLAAANLSRAASNASNTSSALTSNVSSPAAERKFDIGDPFKRLKPHKQHTIPCPIDFASRAVDWSVDGKWCVGVGDHGMIVIFSRGGGGGEQK